MKKIILDGSLMETEIETHNYLKSKLNLPDYYGRNLDALWDSLVVNDERLNIEFINTDSLINSLGMYAYSLIDTFIDLSKENANIEVKFAVIEESSTF